MTVARPRPQRPDQRPLGAPVRPGSSAAARPRARPATWRVGWRALLISSLVATGAAVLVAGNVARAAASATPAEWAGALFATALLGVFLPLLALLLWAAAGRGRLPWRRRRTRAAGTRSRGAAAGAAVALAVGLLPVVAARTLFGGLSWLSWSAWRVVGDLAGWRPPDARLLGLLGGFTPLGVLGAAALVLLWVRCSPGRAGAAAARAARGPETSTRAARRSPAARPLAPPAPFAKGVVRPGQAPLVLALRGAPLAAPEGYLTLTEAAAAFGVNRQRLQAAARRGAVPARKGGDDRTSPWVLRARDVAGYLAARPRRPERRPGHPEGTGSAGGGGPAGDRRPVRVSDGSGRGSARARLGRGAAR